jgi:hypothetical protein
MRYAPKTGREALALQVFPIGHHRRYAGEDHKELCRVGKSEVAHGEQVKRISRNMVDEDRDECQPAQKIDA